MCMKSKCEKCNKTTWIGCGRHVDSVYKQIPEGQHCMCKDWPGVVIEKKEAEGGSGNSTSTGVEGEAQTSTPK